MKNKVNYLVPFIVLMISLFFACKSAKYKKTSSTLFDGYEILDLPLDTVFIGGIYEFENSQIPIADTNKFKTYVYKSYDTIHFDLSNSNNSKLYLSISKKLNLNGYLNNKINYKIKIKKAYIHTVYNPRDLKISIGQIRLIEAIKVESIEIITEDQNNIQLKDSLVKYKKIENSSFEIKSNNKTTIVCNGLNLFVAVKKIKINNIVIKEFKSYFNSQNTMVNNDYNFLYSPKKVIWEGPNISIEDTDFVEISCMNKKSSQEVFKIEYNTVEEFTKYSQNSKNNGVKLKFLNGRNDSCFGYLKFTNKLSTDYINEIYIWSLNSNLIDFANKRYFDFPIIFPINRVFEKKHFTNSFAEIRIKNFNFTNATLKSIHARIFDVEVKYIFNQFEYEVTK